GVIRVVVKGQTQGRQVVSRTRDIACYGACICTNPQQWAQGGQCVPDLRIKTWDSLRLFNSGWDTPLAQGLPSFKQTFVANSYDSEASAVSAGVEQLAVQIDDVLRTHQRTLYGRINTELLSAGAAGTLARKLNGTKGLLSSYVSLLLPRTVEGNEYVSSLLSGNQSILSGPDVAAIYANAQTAPIPDTTQKIDLSTI